MLTCNNCGFTNAEGDEFCGSCGGFLEWNAEAAHGPVPSEAASTESPGSVDTGSDAARGSDDTSVSTADGFAAPAFQPDAGEEITCSSCRRSNPPGRSFCQQCGKRLTIPEPKPDNDTPPPGGAWSPTRRLAIAAAAAALIAIAGGAVLAGVGGSGTTSTTPSGSPVASGTNLLSTASPDPTTSATPIASSSPTPSPTPSPSPTPLPPTPPPPTPTPELLSCDGSTAPDGFATLSPAAPTASVGSDAAWCIHQVIFIAGDGRGTIGLYVGDVLLYDVVQPDDFTEGAEVIVNYSPAVLVQRGSELRYVADCIDASCSALVQFGYDEVALP